MMDNNIEFLRIASDTHLEHRGFTFRSNPDKTRGLIKETFPEDDRDSRSALILAGDIGSYLHIELLLEVLTKRFPRVVYVPGNHEFYGHSIEKVDEHYAKVSGAYPNTSIVRPNSNVSTIVTTTEGDIVLLACTLWADGDPTLGPIYKSLVKGMTDFHVISYRGNLLTPRDMAELNSRDSSWLEDNLSDSPRTIVVTHHLPSHNLIEPRYLGQLSNHGFASDQSRLFPKVALWVYGHTHHQKNAVLPNHKGTRFISNPLGYPNEPCGYGFNPTLFFPLKELP